MINPADITNNQRTQAELEDFLLFCIIVAGKTSKTQAKALSKFYTLELRACTPFEIVRQMIKDNNLLANLKEAKIGQYTKVERAFIEAVNSELNLATCSVDDLEKIHGIGRKTSRFFVVHTRGSEEYAVLDTHILYYLREVLKVDAPKVTPSDLETYNRLQKIFVDHAREKGVSVADLDMSLWVAYSEGKIKKNP